MFRENFDDYKGMECTQTGDIGGDKQLPIYFPVVKNQTVKFSFSSNNFKDVDISIQSCVGCSTSSAFEFMNYKTSQEC